jgi:hypothetical protein
MTAEMIAVLQAHKVWYQGFENGFLVLLDMARKAGAIEEKERIGDLIEGMPFETYHGVSLDGKALDTVTTPKVLNRTKVLELIQGEQK